MGDATVLETVLESIKSEFIGCAGCRWCRHHGKMLAARLGRKNRRKEPRLFLKNEGGRRMPIYLWLTTPQSRNFFPQAPEGTPNFALYLLTYFCRCDDSSGSRWCH